MGVMSQNKKNPAGRAARQGHFEWAFLHPRYWLQWLIIALLRLLVLLPLPVQHRMGRFIGRQFYRKNAMRRRIAEINIGLCFPEFS